MNAPAHTPGPWQIYAGDPLVIVDSEGSSLGEMTAGDPFIQLPAQLANARLVAASPQLLDAARAALAWIDNWIKLGGPVSHQLRSVLLALMAAIAAAEPRP